MPATTYTNQKPAVSVGGYDICPKCKQPTFRCECKPKKVQKHGQGRPSNNRFSRNDNVDHSLGVHSNQKRRRVAWARV